MGIFRRGARDRGDERHGAPADLSTTLLEGEDMLHRLTEAHLTWGLGSAQQWGLDQSTGTITWTFADKVATAPAQILASYNASAGSWLWAWANPSVLPELSRASDEVRRWAEANGHGSLTVPKVDADAELANTFTAIAASDERQRLLSR